MKKFLFIMMLGLLWSSCSNEEVVVPPTDNTATTALRTKEEAIAIAENLNAARQENGSRATAKTLKSVDIIGSTNSRTASDTLIYALNYDDNAGFVLVSAAKTGIAVIGYTDEGNFDSEQAAENPNFSYYLDAAKSYVSTQALTPTGPIIDPSTPMHNWLRINPVVEVQWGQDYPEGIYCPNKLSGCVQTAVAQMMTVLASCSSLELTYEGKTADKVYLNWTSLKQHSKSINTTSTSSVNTHLSSCEATNNTHIAIGQLCRQLGVLNKATYHTNPRATGANSYNALATMKQLHPGKTITEMSKFDSKYENLFDLLYKNKGNAVAYIEGWTQNNEGHAWICDGGEDIQTISQFLKIDGTYERFVEHDIYYHFNWGWSGVDDGFFAAGVFDTSKPSSRYNFSYDLQYFVAYK